ncbi:MAG TPA: hypothetical protein VD928_02075 [Candidatus Paceibacterota bacterium]|nr:hypothetical protein [Candidatus Paceibacterota bacterium]
MAKGKPRDDNSAVDKLKNRLYAREETPSSLGERSELTHNDEHVPRSWKDIEPPHSASDIVTPESIAAEPGSFSEIIPEEYVPPRPPDPLEYMSFAKKFLFGSFLFFILAFGASALLFFGGVNTTSPQNIDVQVIAPSLIDGGSEAEVQIIITNRNSSPLELVDLVIDYPDGSRNPQDPTVALTHERFTIGTIRSGQQVKHTTRALFFGQEGTADKILARLEYTIAGSNAVFEREGEALYTIGSSPVSLAIKGPSRVTSGDRFTYEITVRSNAAAPVENVVVEGQYPFGFSVAGTAPQASAGGTLWRLGTFDPGESKVITLMGSIDASDGDERVFRFAVGSNADTTDPHVKVPFLTVPQTLTVEGAFITGSIAVEGKKGANIVVPAGKTLQGTVSWENNLSEALSDVELLLTLDGPALDKNSVNAQNGFFQSSNTSIIWTKEREGSLGTVPPGGSGTFQFSFATLPPGAQGTLITNPTITLNLQVRGNRQSDSGPGEAVSSVASTKVTLASALELTAQAHKFAGPFSNTGPLPPRAEEESTYTITWTLKNSANTVANAKVETILPPYMRFITAEGGAGITYDEGARTVRWALGDVKAGAGYTLAARQASFQVAILPSTSQVGTIPALTGTTVATGQDRFAQVSVEARADGPTTHTSDAQGGMDIVVPK